MVAILASLIAVVAVAVAIGRGPSLAPPTAPTAAPATASPAGDAALATLRRELEDTARILDEAQSALAQRDREISAANDELTALKRAMADGAPAADPADPAAAQALLAEANARLVEVLRTGGRQAMRLTGRGLTGFAVSDRSGGLTSIGLWSALPPPPAGSGYGIWITTAGQSRRVGGFQAGIPLCTVALPPGDDVVEAIAVHLDPVPPTATPGPVVVAGAR
jgi:hypothetical protein